MVVFRKPPSPKMVSGCLVELSQRCEAQVVQYKRRQQLEVVAWEWWTSLSEPLEEWALTVSHAAYSSAKVPSTQLAVQRICCSSSVQYLCHNSHNATFSSLAVTMKTSNYFTDPESINSQRESISTTLHLLWNCECDGKHPSMSSLPIVLGHQCRFKVGSFQSL